MKEENPIANLLKVLDRETILELVVIVAVAAVLIIAIQRLLPPLADRLHGKKRLDLLAVIPLVRLLLISTALVMIVPLLIEPSMQNMVALLGTVGLAVGFALKDYVSSLIAGILVVSEKPYRNGDWIEIGGVYGEVRHVGMRTVEVVTPDDNRVTIPHSRLWTEAVSNANSGTTRLQCAADFYVDPRHDAVRARHMLRNVALTSPYLCVDNPISVIVRETPWGTHYRIKAYPVDSAQQFRFTSDMTVRGKAALSSLGAEFVAFSPAVERQA
ncbi:MAG: mechanosensitive ion channel family protein [Desulfatiglandales bacterium]